MSGQRIERQPDRCHHPSLTTPELAIADAELVIGLGRSVLEAMATGRAAFVYSVVGGYGWVTPERYSAMEVDGFTGTAANQLPINADGLADELGCWSEEMGEANRDPARAPTTTRASTPSSLSTSRAIWTPHRRSSRP